MIEYNIIFRVGAKITDGRVESLRQPFIHPMQLLDAHNNVYKQGPIDFLKSVNVISLWLDIKIRFA